MDFVTIVRQALLCSLLQPVIFIAHIRSIVEGNDFTDVCHSDHRGGGLPLPNMHDERGDCLLRGSALGGRGWSGFWWGWSAFCGSLPSGERDLPSEGICLLGCLHSEGWSTFWGCLPSRGGGSVSRPANWRAVCIILECKLVFFFKSIMMVTIATVEFISLQTKTDLRAENIDFQYNIIFRFKLHVGHL